MKTRDPAPGSARLFLAFWPSPAVRARLAAQQAQWTWPAGARPTPADNLHLTLHFIGAVPRMRLDDVAGALKQPLERCTLTLDRCEVWPNRCAVWCADTLPGALAVLHGALAQALSALDLPLESRPFRPHVTLARHAAGADPPPQPRPLHWPVRGYALVESAAGRYRPVAHYA